jgi:GMP reductase
MTSMDKALKYEDICLVPNYSKCNSRSELSTFTVFGRQRFKLPIVPANMKSVISWELAEWMTKNRYFYIMHRFDSEEDRLQFLHVANHDDWQTISISVGVNDSEKEFLIKAASLNQRIDYITIDIAHGDCLNMVKMIKHTKRCFPEAFLIAGNVATPQGVVNLSEAGADAVKVGIGQGSPCTTKDKTGFTMPMFSCVGQCTGLSKNRTFELGDEESESIPIIADGGVKCNGDIAKALVAGANMVMAGGLFATCSDSPAETIKIDGKVCKAYFGSASAQNKGHNNHIEGTLKNLTSDGMTYATKLKEIQQDLQSSISYAGGINIECLKEVGFNTV